MLGVQIEGDRKGSPVFGFGSKPGRCWRRCAAAIP